jgi:molybdate transport system ATP-binding protein
MLAPPQERPRLNLRLRNVSLPLSDFTLEVDAEFACQATGIFGPSGAGKTTLLDVIAGLRRPQSGLIELDGQVLFDSGKDAQLPARLRRIGYVPQDLALFPHLSVEANLRYGYKADGGGHALFSFEHVTELLEIGALVGRGVRELSGGEKQRVVLARALLSSPRMLLFDEPLASLDRNLKRRIIPYFQRIRDEFHLPMVYVSHDVEELAALCHEVWLLERGAVAGKLKPEELRAG